MHFTILHVITGLADGGAEANLYRLCTNDHGNRHIVVSLMNSGKYGSLLEQQGIEVHAMNMRPGTLSLAKALRLIEIVRTVNPHIVQTWMYHGSLLGSIAGKIAGASAIVWSIHHTTFDRIGMKRSTELVMRVLAMASPIFANAIIYGGKRAAAIHLQYGYAEKLSKIVLSGYDLDVFKPLSDCPSKTLPVVSGDKETRLIGMVARYHPQKDHGNLLEAFRILLAKGQKCRLVLVGTGVDVGNAELQRSIAQKGITDHVTLLGPCDDVPRLMNVLDLHVLSSAFGEAFPNVLAEAMACATPCVTTDVGDAADIVGETGWVVSPRDPVALVHAIESALGELNTEKWRMRSEAARKRIKENFSMERMVEGYNAVWREVSARVG